MYPPPERCDIAAENMASSAILTLIKVIVAPSAIYR